jgi:hypothetical protein
MLELAIASWDWAAVRLTVFPLLCLYRFASVCVFFFASVSHIACGDAGCWLCLISSCWSGSAWQQQGAAGMPCRLLLLALLSMLTPFIALAAVYGVPSSGASTALGLCRRPEVYNGICDVVCMVPVPQYAWLDPDQQLSALAFGQVTASLRPDQYCSVGAALASCFLIQRT